MAVDLLLPAPGSWKTRTVHGSVASRWDQERRAACRSSEIDSSSLLEVKKKG
jgi:hypothetical protein